MLLASLSPVRLCFQKFPPLSPRQFLVYSSLTLFALVLAVYSHAFHCEFIDFDDNTHVFANPSVLAGLHPRAIFWVFSHFIAAQWIPLTWLSHMLDISLFGTDPAFHHLTNLILHALNSLLVFLVWQRLTRDPWPSLAVALLFAVHPINVESVAWIAERKNLLSSTFWLLALAAYSTHASRSPSSDRRYLWLTTAFMALGLLAKPMLVTLPFALLLLDHWPLQRHHSLPLKFLLLEKIPLFALSLLFSAITLAAAHSTGALASPTSLPILDRLTNALIADQSYLLHLLWPQNLAVLYPIKAAIPLSQTIAPLFLLASITFLSFRFRKKLPHLLFGWLWFLGILIPVSGIFQVGSQSSADRFAYLPQLGIFTMIVWSLRALPAPTLRWFPLATALTITLLATATTQQLLLWTDTASLFEHTIAVTKNNPLAHAIAGIGQVRRQNYPQAVLHYRQASRLLPRNPEIHSLLAEALTHTHHQSEAIQHLQISLTLDPHDEHTRKNLVALLAQSGRLQEATLLLPP